VLRHDLTQDTHLSVLQSLQSSPKSSQSALVPEGFPFPPEEPEAPTAIEFILSFFVIIGVSAADMQDTTTKETISSTSENARSSFSKMSYLFK
jgi:hypothetical protein